MPKKIMFTLEQEQNIIKLYEINKESPEQISHKFNVYKNVILRILNNNNIHIRNSSESHIGQKVWNKGLTKEIDKRVQRTEYSILKQSNSMKGRQKSEEHKNKLSNARKEYYKSHPEEIERRKKICGELAPNFGNHFNHTEEAKQKISIGNTGKIRSKEFKKKDSEIKKEFFRLHPEKIMNGEKNGMYGRSGILSPTYGKLPPNPKKCFEHLTPFQGVVKMFNWEHLYASYLDSINEPYWYEPQHYKMNINGKDCTYTPDFYLPSETKFIEIKGYFRTYESKLKSWTFDEIIPYPFKYEVLFKQDLQNLGVDLK